MSMKRDIKDGAQTSVLVLLGGVAAFVILLLLGAMFLFGFGLFSNATANFRGNVSVQNKTKASGDYRIAQYDHFFDLCAGVQNQEVTIAAQKAELADPATTSARAGQIRGNLSALAANRGELINQYNVDARKSYTAGQFRDSSLPYQIDPTEEHTTCTA